MLMQYFTALQRAKAQKQKRSGADVSVLYCEELAKLGLEFDDRAKKAAVSLEPGLFALNKSFWVK
jgi:hypothetical protein